MKSAYLGQFADETAQAIADELEAAGIDWTYKQAGAITTFLLLGERGTRLFVEDTRLDDARRIADQVAKRLGA